MKSTNMSTNGTPVLNDRGNPRVMMWCVPRSVSTAVAKCMSFIEGAEVWLEPYNTCKLAYDVHHRYHPEENLPLEFEGNEGVFREAAKNLKLGGMFKHLELLSPLTLKRKFDNLDPAKKLVFIKDIAIGMPPSRYPYLPDRSSGIKHFFLIRHPVKVYKSLRKCLLNFFLTADPGTLVPGKKIPDPDTFDFIKYISPPQEGTLYNYEAIHELWSHIRNTVDDEPVILDVDELLENPQAMLPRLCNALGIPYSESLLSWDSSSDVILEWKSSCSNIPESPSYSMWFTDALKSTCFKASATTTSLEDATDDCQEMYFEKKFTKSDIGERPIV